MTIETEILANGQARLKTSVNQERTLNAVRTACTIIGDNSFLETLRGQGILTLPQLLLTTAEPNGESEQDQELSQEDLLDQTLSFVIMWTFFYPLFTNPVIATHLETSWPGFTNELKDTFISLSLEGPLPQQARLYRGQPFIPL